MAEHHYIIKFDDVTKTWSQDTDSEEVRFVDGTIYDEAEQAWFAPYQGDGQFYRNADEIDERLSTVIDLLEGLKK
jgi:hypothetical protein